MTGNSCAISVCDNRTLRITEIRLNELPALMLYTFDNELRIITSLTDWSLVHNWNPCRLQPITHEPMTIDAKGWMACV
jgi:hypothetical protein